MVMKHVSKSWDNPSRRKGETLNAFFVDFVYETFLETNLGGGFKYFLLSPLHGKIIQFG